MPKTSASKPVKKPVTKKPTLRTALRMVQREGVEHREALDEGEAMKQVYEGKRRS